MTAGATNFPTSLDTTTNLPLAATLAAIELDGDGTDDQKHSNWAGVIGGAAVALETKLGIGASTPGAAGKLLVATSATASAWQNSDIALSSGITGAGIWALAGSSLTEATTTSTSTADMHTITGLSIPATTPMLVMCVYRKTSGAAAECDVGLKLNATQVNANEACCTATDRAENGVLWYFVGPRVGNYRSGLYGVSSSPYDGYVHRTASNPMPTAAITDVIITGLTDSASVTFAVDEVRVYTMPVA